MFNFFPLAVAVALLSAITKVAKASDFSFRPSVYDTKEQSIKDTKLAAMDMIIPGTSTNLKNFLVENAIIDDQGNGDAVSAFHTFSALEVLTGEPLPCAQQSFGKDGEWTNDVCMAYDEATDICSNDEASCELSTFPAIVAGKMSNLEKQRKATTMLLCYYLNGIENPFLCFFPAQSIVDRVNLVFQLIDSFVPDGVNNDLLSNSRGMAKGIDEFNGLTDPDTNYVLGDGKLNLYVKVLGIRKATLQTKYVSGPELLAFMLKYDVQSPLDELHIDALGGYYSQRYAERFFTARERKLFVNHSKFVFQTECGATIGILSAARCGFNAEDVGPFLQYYDSLLVGDYENDSDRYCSGITNLRYRQARKYMKSHDFDLATKKLTNKKCMKKIGLWKTVAKAEERVYYNINELPSADDVV